MIIKIEIPDKQYKKFDKYYDVEGSIEDYIETIVENIEKMEKEWEELGLKAKEKRNKEKEAIDELT